MEIPEEVSKYVYTVGNRISNLKIALRKETEEKFAPWAHMLTNPAQGELLKMLVRLSNAKFGIEIGVFTGYSSSCISEALPHDGNLLCIDVNKGFTELAKKYWTLMGVENKCKLILRPGLETLDQILSDEANVGAFDFAYVDADKINYLGYYERLIKLIKKGGWISFDNTLWKNKVVYEDFVDDNTMSLRQLNSYLQKDERVDINLLPIGDGFTIVRIK